MARKKTTKKKAKTRRTAKANAAPGPVIDAVEVRRENGKVWSHVRQMWLVEE